MLELGRSPAELFAFAKTSNGLSRLSSSPFVEASFKQEDIPEEAAPVAAPSAALAS